MKQTERRTDFERTAERRYAAILGTGKTIPWKAMRRYLEAQIAGKPVRSPVALKRSRARQRNPLLV
jgi:hypothetical protein